MNEDKPTLYHTARCLINDFALLAPFEEKQACDVLITSFIGYYSLLGEDARFRTARSLLILMSEIGSTAFEDKEDLLSFLRELAEDLKK